MSNERWFLPSEVVIHNTLDDIWVIIHQRVLNLTNLITNHKDNKNILPILWCAGKDISYWFDDEFEFKTYINPVSGGKIPYTQYGPVLHLDEHFQETKLVRNSFIPWWKNRKYIIGYLTKNPRPIKIFNTLTGIIINLNVCEENTFHEIGQRYERFHSDWFNYSWWYLDRPIVMSKTLLENGVIDEREKYLKLNLPYDFYVPVILLHYNDDCSIECEKLKFPIVNEFHFLETNPVVDTLCR